MNRLQPPHTMSSQDNVLKLGKTPNQTQAVEEAKAEAVRHALAAAAEAQLWVAAAWRMIHLACEWAAEEAHGQDPW
jgi:hypothetical protein